MLRLQLALQGFSSVISKCISLGMGNVVSGPLGFSFPALPPSFMTSEPKRECGSKVIFTASVFLAVGRRVERGGYCLLL